MGLYNQEMDHDILGEEEMTNCKCDERQSADHLSANLR